MRLEGTKVVSATTMAAIEKQSVAEGASDASYMLEAGKQIAIQVEDFISLHRLDPKITLLVGKGNNGGDAFVCGIELLKRKFEVSAITLFGLEEVSPLSQKYWKQFILDGGKLCQDLPCTGVIIDGLLGTGFSGDVKEPIRSWIERVNECDLPVIAIDVPSGIGSSCVIGADITLYLGMPKSSCFLDHAFDSTGFLIGCDFGMSQKYVEQVDAFAYLINDLILPELLPEVKPTRHKYEAGYILALAGSHGMPGAAIMACHAAYRSGAGIIRLFHSLDMDGDLAQAPFELVRSVWDPGLFDQEKQRASAFLIGPGLGQTHEVRGCIDHMLDHLDRPAVIDADALAAVAKKRFETPVVLTPHKGEALALFGQKFTCDQELLAAAQSYVDEYHVTIVLKGAPSFIVHTGKPLLIMDRGAPGLATAGTGDVLTGIIAALLAQGLGGREAATLGTWLHALAGERAVLDKTDYGLMATDLIEYLPEIFSELEA